MGITDINKTLKAYAPKAYTTLPMKNFKGKAIGIDASLWAYKAKSSAMKSALSKMPSDSLENPDPDYLVRNIVYQFYGLTDKFTQFGITPVWVFDGQTHPAKLAVDLRKKAKSVQKKSLEEQREEISEMEPLEREKNMPRYRNALIACSPPNKDEMNAIKNNVESLGLPSFIAPYDAEIYASKLCKMDFLSAVYTTDTDTFACGATITITGISPKSSKDGAMFEAVVNYDILYEMGITQEELTDFCILHGCDFNQRSKGLGPVSIYKKMQDYGWSIEDMKEHENKIEWECLNIEECRQIFLGDIEEEYTMEDFTIDEKKWKKKTQEIEAFELNLPEPPTKQEFDKIG